MIEISFVSNQDQIQFLSLKLGSKIQKFEIFPRHFHFGIVEEIAGCDANVKCYMLFVVRMLMG